MSPSQAKGLCCPNCNNTTFKTLETRKLKVAETERRKECKECGLKFRTVETFSRIIE